MEVPTSQANEKYYIPFVPTNSARAMRQAGSHLHCCEDIVVKGKLGRGYFAAVFLVLHRPTNELMAMKLTNDASVQRREIEILSSLNHENVIRLYGSCVIGARFACLTEFANGGNLASLLPAKLVDLSWSVRTKLALDIARGLQHLHCHQLIHRDLSSANILIRMSPNSLPSDGSPNGGMDMFNSANHLAYATSVGRNLVVSDKAFLRECLNEVRVTAKSTATGDLGPRDLTEREQMDDVNYTLDQTINGNHCSSVKPEERPKPTTTLLSLPVIEPVWKRASVWSTGSSLSSNSMVYTALVADLGLCLDLSQEHVDRVSLVGNPYYIAPECLNRIAPYTFAADVFAFGILQCELITRSVNDGISIPRTQNFGLDHQKLPVPPNCPRQMLQSTLDCCTLDHLQRPSIDKIITVLSNGIDMHHHQIIPSTCPCSSPLVGHTSTSGSLIPKVTNESSLPIALSHPLDV